MSRPWLALVLVLFCLPLFLGLRSLDLETDEAIYSFAVDRILEVGEWLQPKSSTSETAVFLEKPPLKFWIVAAPIRAGLLPHNEFGLRFWDALFGAVAFLYVFAIGSLLAGPVCGAVAVLLLFVHWPLLLDHGLRTNNMEGPLFLCYCGGVFHFLRWAEGGSRPRAHAVATGLYFVLGFMTKFVAALFLPATLGLAALLFRATRQRLMADWRLWLSVSGMAFLLIAPWFIYAQVQFGNLLWQTMLEAHVYERFTVGLNQAHVHPWNYYYIWMFDAFSRSGLQWLIPVGVAVLVIQSARRRSFIGTVVALWATLPLFLISFGSSKLYHYTYPFLPPLTIAAGYVVALVAMLAPTQVRRVLEGGEDLVARMLPRLSAASARSSVANAASVVIWAAAILAVWALLFEQVKVAAGGVVLFKSSGALRPIVVMMVAALLARRGARVALPVVALSIAAWMPIATYKATFPHLLEARHPLRDVSECIGRVEATTASAGPQGLYVDTDSSMWHPIYYYFRRLRPWVRQTTPSPENLDRAVYDTTSPMPSLVQELRYRDYLAGPEAARFTRGISPPMMSMLEYVLLLPGPYAVCSPEAPLHASD